jgi:hypothetical protein
MVVGALKGSLRIWLRGNNKIAIEMESKKKKEKSELSPMQFLKLNLKRTVNKKAKLDDLEERANKEEGPKKQSEMTGEHEMLEDILRSNPMVIEDMKEEDEPALEMEMESRVIIMESPNSDSTSDSDIEEIWKEEIKEEGNPEDKMIMETQTVEKRQLISIEVCNPTNSRSVAEEKPV